MGHSRGQSDTGSDRTAHNIGHRREQSEASIMDRGRPKKRTEGSPITLKRSLSKQRAQQVEQKAFETLPEGIKASDAQQRWSQEAIDALKKQAMGQAAKFEVLGMKVVESLSRVSVYSKFDLIPHFISHRQTANALCIRNSEPLTNVANTSVKHTILSGPVVTTCMNAFVLIFAHHAQLSFLIPLS